MEFRLPRPEELSALERGLGRAETEDRRGYAPSTLPAYRPIAPEYPEWAFTRSRLAPLRDRFLASSILGAYLPATDEILINPDGRSRGGSGVVELHERLHELFPRRHPDPRENEIMNRLATYAITGDSGQLAFGAYHP